MEKTLIRRESDSLHKVAILATGDEISLGDIINTNSQEIALRLTNQGMQVRMHMVAPDNVSEIEQAIQFLLSGHDALIITGGLGPTSDDLTRYALSNVTNKPLQFDTGTWDAIIERLKKFGYHNPPESNRQQALFPEGATIIHNPNGTAAGCYMALNNKVIFMLPGPPFECLPMVDSVVIPTLAAYGFKQTVYHQKWLLFGVSEGKIAEELDHLAKPFDCLTGYRLCYPYLEFKLHSRNKDDFEALAKLVNEKMRPYVFGDGQTFASVMLQKALKHKIGICDLATGGLLEATINTPETHEFLSFSSEPERFANDLPHVVIRGLDEFWQGETIGAKATISLEFVVHGQREIVKDELPFRNYRVRIFAVEMICQAILKNLLTI